MKEPPETNEPHVTRRALLKRGGSLLGLFVLPVLPACRRAEAHSCTEPNLSEGDRKVRNQLQYVEQATEPGRTCEKCVQYVPPGSDSNCGTCKLMSGAIQPLGTCAVFAAAG